MNLFISGHGCRLNDKFKPNKLGRRPKFYFMSGVNEDLNLLPCSKSIDNIDLNTEHYRHGPVKHETPSGIDDYRITFPDKAWEWGLINTGIFVPSPGNAGPTNFILNENGSLAPAATQVHKLSDIVNVFMERGFENFYLTICRGPCDQQNNLSSDVYTGGKKRKYNKKIKNRRSKRTKRKLIKRNLIRKSKKTKKYNKYK